MLAARKLILSLALALSASAGPLLYVSTYSDFTGAGKFALSTQLPGRSTKSVHSLGPARWVGAGAEWLSRCLVFREFGFGESCDRGRLADRSDWAGGLRLWAKYTATRSERKRCG
jgi:hypothetical protein